MLYSYVTLHYSDFEDILLILIPVTPPLVCGHQLAGTMPSTPLGLSILNASEPIDLKNVLCALSVRNKSR